MHDDSTVSINYLNKVSEKKNFFLVGEFLNFVRLTLGTFPSHFFSPIISYPQADCVYMIHLLSKES